MATEEDKTNNGALATLVVVSVFSMIAVTLGVTAIARDAMGTAREEKEAAGANEYRALKQSQLEQLSQGSSIDQIKQQIVQQLQRDPGSASPAASASASAAAGSAAPAASDTPPAGQAPQPSGSAVPGQIPGVVAPVSSSKGTNSPEHPMLQPHSPLSPPADKQAPVTPAPATPAPAGSTHG